MSLSLLQIDSDDLRKKWRSCTVDPWLRVVVIITAMIYNEQDARFCKLLSLDEARTYGRVADISVLGLPGVRKAAIGEDHHLPVWIVNRINVLFPFGDGDKDTAIYNGEVIRLEVPFFGYAKNCLALRDWMEWGAKRKKMRPRQIRLIEPEILVAHGAGR